MNLRSRLYDRYFGHDHVLVIKPPRGWNLLDVNELWLYRELLYVLAGRDIKVRYKQTVLGFAWAIIQPVMLMVVFSIFFGHLAKMPSDGLPYPVFVYAGLLPWTFFANSVTSSANSLVGSAGLVSKVYFPRLIIPLSSVGSGLVDFAIAAIVLLLLMIYYGVSWSFNLVMVPILVVGVVLTALGVGTCLAALNVAYRDFRYLVSFLVQFWMFATPVVYPASIVPSEWQWALFLNPMAGVIEGFRSAFLGRPFDVPAMLVSLVIAALLFITGIAYFGKVERRFADII
jgi:lipopolysaccharide transport system permease protein